MNSPKQFSCVVDDVKHQFIAYIAYPDGNIMRSVAIALYRGIEPWHQVFFKYPLTQIDLISQSDEQIIDLAISIFQKRGWPARLIDKTQGTEPKQFSESFKTQ